MSVLLEGTIPDADDPLEWCGVWQFVRDRSAKVQFSYERKSCDVPNELINYVSFQGGTASEAAATRGPRSKKRGRGRTKKSEAAMAEDMDISGDAGDREEEAAEDASGSTAIRRTHRLFGYYEGTFDVKSGVGSEDTSVPESLFIYSVAAQPAPPEIDEDDAELSDSETDNRVVLARSGHSLPPEQIFSYSVMKILKEEYSGSEEPTKDKRMYKAALHSANARASAAATATAHAAATAVATEASASASSSSEAVDVSGEGVLAVNTGGTTAGTASPKFVDCAAVQAESLPAHFTLVLGFGRNVFGRFALVGAYNERTRLFICEKRYMVSKYTGINRYRLPQVATSRYADDGDDGDGGPGSLGRRKRVSTSATRLMLEDMDSPAKESHRSATPRGDKGDRGDTSAEDGGLVAQLTAKGQKKYSRKEKAARGKEGRIHGNCKSHRERHGGLTQAQLQKQNELRAVYDRYLPDDVDCGSAPDMAENGLYDSSGNVVSTYKSASIDPDTGDIYEGGWLDGFRHGRGICLYALPSVLVETKDQEITRNSSCSLLSDKNDGSQTYYMYEGDWYRGKEQGQGLYMTGDREVIYEGEFVDGVKQGFGTYYFANGDTYTGDFKEGLRHGKGTYTFAGKLGSYEGDWRDDKRHGRGVFTWYNDNDEVIDGKVFHSTYNGDWDHNQRHGRGVLLLTNGFYYDGNWDRGTMEGRGECIYPIPTSVRTPGGGAGGTTLPPTPSRSGSPAPKSPRRSTSGSSLSAKDKAADAPEQNKGDPIVQQLYQGSFKAGLRDGRGTIIFAEGGEYEGRFRDDRLDGHAGTMKVTQPVPGLEDGEIMIPVTLQADIKRIHYMSGFGEGSTH